MIFPNTTDIVSRGQYFATPAEFFSNFPDAWAGARCQVLKLETRQTYIEPLSNKSYSALATGDVALSKTLIPESRAGDVALYRSLRERGIDFIRCRPLSFPLSSYADWEMSVYDFNSTHGERIYCCNLISLSEIFDTFAKHDFMVFDTRLAFVHDYNSEGEISGGWKIVNAADVVFLINLFAFIKANCQPYIFFKK